MSAYHQIKSEWNLALNGEATRLRNKRQGEPVSKPFGLAMMVKMYQMSKVKGSSLSVEEQFLLQSLGRHRLSLAYA